MITSEQARQQLAERWPSPIGEGEVIYPNMVLISRGPDWAVAMVVSDYDVRAIAPRLTGPPKDDALLMAKFMALRLPKGWHKWTTEEFMRFTEPLVPEMTDYVQPSVGSFRFKTSDVDRLHHATPRQESRFR